MRSLVLVLALLAAGCSGGSQLAAGRRDGATAAPVTKPGAAVPVPPSRSSAPLSARVRLRSRTVPAGSSAPGRVVVQNNTGHAIRVSGCGVLFQVALASARYSPAVAWPACLQMLTIPAGESSYPVTVLASYLQCHEGRTQGAIRACLPDRRPPPLPPGDYRARLFQLGHLVVALPGPTVRVTARPGQGGQVRYRRG